MNDKEVKLTDDFVTRDMVAPMPVEYPSWIDWLCEMGLIYKPVGWGSALTDRDENIRLVCVTTPKARESIPAEIAEKLPGIRKRRANDG